MPTWYLDTKARWLIFATVINILSFLLIVARYTCLTQRVWSTHANNYLEEWQMRFLITSKVCFFLFDLCYKQINDHIDSFDSLAFTWLFNIYILLMQFIKEKLLLTFFLLYLPIYIQDKYKKEYLKRKILIVL